MILVDSFLFNDTCLFNNLCFSIFTGPKHKCILTYFEEIYKLLENKLWDDPNMVIFYWWGLHHLINKINIKFLFCILKKTMCHYGNICWPSDILWLFVSFFTDITKHGHCKCEEFLKRIIMGCTKFPLCASHNYSFQKYFPFCFEL